MNPLRFPIHFRQPFADHWRLRVQGISLLVIVNSLRGVFAAAGGLVLHFGNVAHGVIEIGVGATGSWRSSRFAVSEILLLRGCRLRRRGGLRKSSTGGKSRSEKHCAQL